MDIILEYVVKDITKAYKFYNKYFGFKLDFEEYTPVSWMQLSNGNTKLMLVTYDFTKNDIPNFKKFTSSTNIYKFTYDSLGEVKKVYDKLVKDNKKVFLPLRKADFRYEFGVYDEDNNMIMATYLTKE